VNEIISKSIQASDQLELLFDSSLRRFGYLDNMQARFVIQKLRDDLLLFQNPSLALATINSYEMIQPDFKMRETISALSSHSPNFATSSRVQLRTQLPREAMLLSANGQKLVRASSASRAAKVLAQRFHLQ
jgi:hypothetical protein